RATASVASTLPMSGVPASARSKPGNLPPVSAYARRLTTLLGTPPARSGLRYDFRYGEPSVDEFPREIWRRLLATRMRRPARDGLGYEDPAGYPPLREALAEYLKRARGVLCEADQIVITSGSQQGFDLAARVLLDPGDVAVVEEPHYPGVTIPFEARGARLAPHPGGGGGGGGGPHAGRRRRTADAAAAESGAGRVRYSLSSVPDRRHHATRAPARAARVGGPRRQLGDRGRLRQRVPVRGASARSAAVPGPRRPRDLRRHVLEDSLPRVASRLRRAAQAARAFVRGRKVGIRP